MMVNFIKGTAYYESTGKVAFKSVLFVRKKSVAIYKFNGKGTLLKKERMSIKDFKRKCPKMKGLLYK